MKKKLMLLAATIVMVLPLILGFLSSVTVQATGGTGGTGDLTFTLHKKRYASGTDPGSIENTGDEMTAFDTVPGLGEVTFNVYNVTNKFYELLETPFPESNPPTNYSYEQALDKVKTDTSLHGTSVKSGTTANADSGSVKVGDLTLSGLDSKTGGKNSVYVIVESEKAGVTIADNMVVVLPILNADGSNKTNIHLYPKNIVSTAGLEVEKVSNLDSDVKLPGAQFVIHRGGEFGATNTEYFKGLETGTGIPLWTTTAADAKVYTTGSEDPNKGKFSESGLLHGTYYLTEIAPPTVDGNIYAIQNGAVNQQFTLSDANPTQKFTGDAAIKNDDLKLTKTNAGGSVNVGDMIEYSVTSQIPTGIRDKVTVEGVLQNRYTKYEIKDVHSEYLLFDEAISALTLSDGKNNFTKEGPTPDYTVAVDATTNTFTVSFTKEGIEKMVPNATLTMTYKLKLLKVDPDVKVKNDATITTDHDTTTGSGKEHYTGGYKFKKIDASNNDATLEGAEFIVSDKNKGEAGAQYLVVDETTGDVTWTTNKNLATVYKSLAGGIVTVTGLENGTYFLEETKPPTDKYVLPSTSTEFEIVEGSFGLTTTTPKDVANTQKGTLPSTGGTGIYVMVAIGLVVMAGAGVWYVRSQRKEA